MKITKNIFILLVSIYFITFLGTNLQAMQLPRAAFADITFLNKTGKTLTLKTIRHDKTLDIPPEEIPGEPALPGIPAHRGPNRYDLSKIEAFEITYKERAATSYIPSAFRSPSMLHVGSQKLLDELAKKNSNQIEISISKQPGLLYESGLAKPEFKVIPQAGKPVEWLPAEEEFTELKPKIESKEEEKILYAELGVEPSANPYEILHMHPWTKEEMQKSPGTFVTLLNNKVKELEKKYDPDDPANRVLDTQMLLEKHIPNFTTQVRDIVLRAKKAIAESWGLA